MTEDTIPPGHVVRGRDPQFREIYSNSSQTHLTPYDITLLFQKNSEIVPGKMGSTDLVSVALSPQHFKAFVKSITETLAAYEATFGKLTISEADTAPLRNAAEIQTVLETARDNARVMARASISPSSTEPPPPGKQSRSAARKKAT
jgi:hypothetical protein